MPPLEEYILNNIIQNSGSAKLIEIIDEVIIWLLNNHRSNLKKNLSDIETALDNLVKINKLGVGEYTDTRTDRKKRFYYTP